MFSAPFIALVSLAYVGLLFAIAWFGDRLPAGRIGPRTRAAIYSLSLAVYCTSWTFFGAVGSAVENGWLFAAIYLGPILIVLFAHDLMKRILSLTRDHRLTSIADFISFRYGKSRPLAALVTLAAVLGSIPYIALQLKAVTMGLVAIAEEPAGLSESSLALLLALALGLFSILFGVRRLEASEHHRGMVLAVAFESLVKLVAFGAVGLWALYAVFGGLGGMNEALAANAEWRERFLPESLPAGFWVQTLLAGAAILCLPRQFQVAFIENERPEDLATARWLFPLYLLVFTLLVVPIALAGLDRFGGAEANADLFVLSLPMAAGHEALTLLSFLGGFSAATGMVIVATVALATMVSNDLVLPLLLRLRLHHGRDFGRLLLISRWLTILVLALAAWIYYLVLQSTDRLAAIGLVSFAAVIQFAPALVLGVYWRRASREGAIAGLVLGLGAWLLLTFLPSIVPAWPAWLQPGLNTATLIGLGLNLAALVGISVWVRRHRPILPMLLAGREGSRALTVGDLRRLAGGFIGRERVDLAFAGALGGEHPLPDDAPAGSELMGFTERLLAGCIGSASARTVLAAGLRRRGMARGEALALLEQTSSAIQFNRDLLEATLDHISQGVSVVDGDLRLVSWNQAYVELLDYPPGMVHIGRPVEELIRYNLERWTAAAPGDIDAAVDRRLYHMRRGTPYVFERRHPDGRVIEIRGNPMPKRGYVTTYTDITPYKASEAALKRAYATMEQQVADRTAELNAAMEALSEAKRDAEAANHGKTKFLAAASHDLLQPLNAARLFSSSLKQSADRLPADEARLVRRVDHSLGVAEELLSSLLDISRLDQGALKPNWTSFPLQSLFDRVERQFGALAQRRGLKLRVRPGRYRVRSDARLLQRVLFNLVGNALRYTRDGGVLVGARLRGGPDAPRVVIEVWDTGPGIPEHEQARIFEEFERIEDASQPEPSDPYDQGLGLGLSICRRISRMLDAPLTLRSATGRGTVFAVEVPVVGRVDAAAVAAAAVAAEPPAAVAAPTGTDFDGLRVLCIDDDPDILDGMRAMLERWGCSVATASRSREALTACDPPPDLIIADHHLGRGENGLDVSDAVRDAIGRRVPVLVVTADRDEALGQAIAERGDRRLFKPVKPAALRAVMKHLLRR
ncbi:hybrid sensor histidine kinase/response regulator [Wenzhouxiangella sp. XN79A]|uniref:hybrid sensor histidine kinase/response regulator n=1 Tax=Wenzhouxiangella sp. XN79A TaxID=2724193 RepID=UPI00144A66EC|nr:PAS domain-containing hybrid sensor histidine kinase/response regulator [Wenzhouxiangella sp. XN79A]NKI35835.1 hybrid sensor histidine kinase/response regulator [Wenzhouxiangella sp. XN79A]